MLKFPLQTHFFRQIDFSKAFFPMGCCKAFLQSFFSHGMLQRFFAIVNCIMVDEIFVKMTEFQHFDEIFLWIHLKTSFLRKIHKLCYSVYLTNNIKILLHDFWLGCNGFATSLGSHFIPRGFAPWDEITPSGCCKTIASRPKVVQ